MAKTEKTITASGRLREPELVDEYQQTCRNLFDVKPVGSIEISAHRGAGSAEISGVDAEDVLDITLEDDIRLFVRRDDFERDFPSAAARAGKRDELNLQALRFGPPSRGVKELALRVLDVFRVPLAEATGVGLCETFEEKSLKQPPGLYTIEPRRSLQLSRPSFPDKVDPQKPLLVFIHGTASSTEGSFGGLWEEGNAALREALFKHYRDRVYALEHQTLTKSPIQNAIDLVEAVPEESVVHLVSHSRGGIVGELVCRCMVPDDEAPFLPAELEAFRQRADAVVQDLEEGRQAARAAYAEQVDLLAALNQKLLDRKIKVERFVRVACPARGTTLASGRLDRWLSVFLNLIGLIPALRAAPYYSLLENFIRALVRTRTKPHQLPGLEAQMPTSPIIGLLNADERKLESDLSVIAGDIEHEGLLGRIALLLPDQFYDTDHDLVVNTPSMYGGGERETVPDRRGERFYFDQGASVSHFNYFRNVNTASRVITGLTGDSEQLKQHFTAQLPDSDEPIPSRSFRTRTGPQPVVFLLPGIMGSELDESDDTVWASKFRLALGGMSRLRITRRKVSSSGLISGSYRALVEYLSQTNEVWPFHYDWRSLVDPDRGVDEVRRLADAVMDKVKEAQAHNKPVSIVAHSMGGLLARLMMVRHRDVWEAMLQHPDSRLIMLGTPNGGSFSIPRMLFGQDKLVKGLALLDVRHSQRELLNIIRQYPGVMFLLPFGDDRFDFFSDATWRELASIADLAVPTPARLAAARKLREQINTHPLGMEEKGRVLYVAGRANETPVSLDIRNNEPVFRGTAEGDGRVPWATGIPTGIPAWYMDAVHGDLASHRPGFEALSDLLKTGQTDRLPERPPAPARGVPQQFDIPPDTVELYPGNREIEAWALGASEPAATPRGGMEKIRLQITHGNLAFSRNVVMVGHYNGDGLFSAENYLDKCLDGRLSDCLQLGLYPGPIGTAELIRNQPYAKPKGALIVGLGDVGKLTLPMLSHTIREAVKRYAFDLQKSGEGRGTGDPQYRPLAVSSLLVGASSGGLPLPDALLGIMRGVKEANEILAGQNDGTKLAIEELQILELWEDRAILASRAADSLFRVDRELSDSYSYDETLEQVKGGQTRAFHEEEPGWWSRLQIEDEGEGVLSFNRITNTARTEKRLLSTEREKVDLFLSQATASPWTQRSLPKTLFEMLIPNELKDSSEGLGDTVLMVDEHSARYPWELLEDRLSRSGKPVAVQSRIIRQLSAMEFRRDPTMSPGNRALVIGEPHTNIKQLWPDLPGAVEEGRLVAGILAGEGGLNVTKLIGTDARAVLKALHSDSYRVMHLAGHGVHEFDLQAALNRLGLKPEAATAGRKVSGMVIGDQMFLNANDIRQMRHVPELVFINCCHLARTDAAERSSDFGALAANLATQFIRMGTRAVVAAGWEVDDRAAKTFAEVFYHSMIEGMDFGDAVYQARRAIFAEHPDVNTWGAYQCYGHPQYTLRGHRPGGARHFDPPKTPADLIARLRSLSKLAATDTDAGRERRLKQLQRYVDTEKVPQLEKWKKYGNVCAAIARAYGEFDRFGDAVCWYEQAAVCETATASVKDFEQYANLLVRRAAAEARKTADEAGFRTAERAIERTLQILDEIDAAMGNVVGFEDTEKPASARTVERESLRGSAYKRQAMIHALSGRDRVEVEQALDRMNEHYRKADEIQLSITGDHDYYPYTARLQALTIRRLMSGRFSGLESEERETLKRLKREGDSRDRENPSFWNMVSAVDCELVLRINSGKLPEHTESIADKYLEAKKRGATPREFRSILETLDFLIALVNPALGTSPSLKRRSVINAALREIRIKLD